MNPSLQSKLDRLIAKRLGTMIIAPPIGILWNPSTNLLSMMAILHSYPPPSGTLRLSVSANTRMVSLYTPKNHIFWERRVPAHLDPNAGLAGVLAEAWLTAHGEDLEA